jgi:predicted FMN-binding regulatory protein PaiB
MSQNRPATDIEGVVRGLRQDAEDGLAEAVVRATGR